MPSTSRPDTREQSNNLRTQSIISSNSHSPYIDIDRAVPAAHPIDTMADTGPELDHDSISSQDPNNKKTKKIKNRRPASASTDSPAMK
jgi:hypothetical protein